MSDPARPLIMGVVNATPDSFSDGGRYTTLDAQRALAHQLVQDGADVLDIGGQSAITGVPEISTDEEIERIAPLLEALDTDLDGTAVEISVDTYRAPVAHAALEAGAHIINDISGLADPQLAALTAQRGARLVLMHNRGRPKQRLTEQDLYDDVVADIERFLTDKRRTAIEHGVPEDRLILDPGPDFAKTPAQTIEALRNLHGLRAFNAPLLLAISRKDFVGALTNRRPRERLAGTLGAIAAIARPGDLLRVHDVREVRDFLEVRAALLGEIEVDPALTLPVELRREPPATATA